jgi:hypothetical protein
MLPLDLIRYGELSGDDGLPSIVTPASYGALWQLRGDTGVSTTLAPPVYGDVTAWAPLVGSLALTNAVSSEQPAFTLANATLNNHPTVNFDGVTERLWASGAVLPAGGCTVIAVAAALTVQDEYLLGTQGTQGWYARPRPADQLSIESVGSSFAPAAYAGAHMLVFRHNADTSNDMGIDGVLSAGDSNRPVASGGTEVTVGTWRGSASGSLFFAGELADLAAFPTLSDTDIATLYARYYSPRYGI